MKTTASWLLAGAAVTLFAGAGVAIAADDAKPQAKPDAKVEQREVRIYRQNGEERIIITKDGERHEITGDRGGTRRFEITRGPEGDRTVIIHEGGGRSEHLKALLQLRPEQEPALKAFLDATQPEHRHGGGMVRVERGTDARTTSDRLAEMEQKLSEQNAAMKKRIDATRAFYAQLDDKQKKAFDAMPMLMMVGPGLGPMMLPGPIPILHRMPPMPAVPPVPPAPPVAPRS